MSEKLLCAKSRISLLFVILTNFVHNIYVLTKFKVNSVVLGPRSVMST